MIAGTVHRPAMRAPLASLGEVVFLGSVVLQGLHFVEHISQVAQKFFLGGLVMGLMLVALGGMMARSTGPSQTKGS